MQLIHLTLGVAMKAAIRLCCRVHDAALTKVPAQGPLIAVSNHINSLELFVLYSHLQPRRMTAFAKAEFWDNPFTRLFFELVEAIPVHRGQVDRTALRRAMTVLQEGYILALAPEGTRSYHGRLQRGRGGAVLIALHSDAPILPIVHYGGERFRENLRHLRRTDFTIVVGRPFRLRAEGTQVTRSVRQQMADEIMYQIAALLPPAYRGRYADLSQATQDYLDLTNT